MDLTYRLIALLLRRSCVLPLLLGGLLSSVTTAHGQFTINGVADKAAPYPDAVSFSISVQPGFTYSAVLNQERIPVGVPVRVPRPGFYELRVAATNVFTSAISNRLVRFIVRSTERGG